MAVIPHPNIKCAYLVFCKANRILNEKRDHLHSPRPTDLFSIHRETRGSKPGGTAECRPGPSEVKSSP